MRAERLKGGRAMSDQNRKKPVRRYRQNLETGVVEEVFRFDLRAHYTYRHHDPMDYMVRSFAPGMTLIA